MFMKLNKGTVFDESFLRKYSLDGFLCVPMSNEEIKVPQEIDDSVNEVIKKFNQIGKNDVRPIKKMIKLMQEHDQVLSQHVDTKTIVEKAMVQIEAVLKGDQPQP